MAATSNLESFALAVRIRAFCTILAFMFNEDRRRFVPLNEVSDAAKKALQRYY